MGAWVTGAWATNAWLGTAWATDTVPAAPEAARAVTPAGGRKRRRFTVWEDEAEIEVKPVELPPAKVLKAIVKAYKGGEKTLGRLRIAVPDGPKLDLVGFLEEMRRRDVLYAVRMENALRKLRDDEDEEDIELLLLH